MSHIHIDIEEVRYRYQEDREVLRGITVHLSEGESVGLLGANGAGKSTLLKLLVGLQTGYEGQIRVEEIPVEKKTLPHIRERIGYVFQDADSQLFMPTVGEDLAFAPRNYGLSEEETLRRVGEALAKVGISHLKDRRIYQLSGGEKRLVSIATILTIHPDIILMDEPEASLDPRNRRNLIRILNGFDHLKLIATHDLDLVWETCERTLILSEGRIAADGPTKEILRDRQLLEENGLELPLRLQN